MNTESVQLKAAQGAFPPIAIIHTDVPAWETCVYVIRSHHCLFTQPSILPDTLAI